MNIYGVLRALPWLLLELIVLVIIAVPIFAVLQLVLVAVSARP